MPSNPDFFVCMCECVFLCLLKTTVALNFRLQVEQVKSDDNDSDYDLPVLVLRSYGFVQLHRLSLLHTDLLLF